MFGGIRFRDIITGAAEAVDEQLKDDISRTKKLADDTAQYHIRRRQERSEQLDVDKQEVEDILEQFAGFVDESKLSGDMNKYDYAAQLMSSAGGNTEIAKEYLADLRESQKVGIDVKKLLNFSQAQTGGRGLKDYVNKFVRRPSEIIDIPDDVAGGFGLYKLFKPQVGKDIRRQVDLAMPKSEDKLPDFDVTATELPFELMKAATDYKDDKDAEALARSVTELNKKKLEKEISLMGTLGVNEIRNLYRDGFKSGSNIMDYDVDPVTGAITSVNNAEALQFLTNLHETQLQTTFKSVLDTNSLANPKVRETMKGLAKTTFDFVTGLGNAPSRINQLPVDNSKAIVGKLYSAEIGGIKGYYMWGGNDENSVFVTGMQ